MILYTISTVGIRWIRDQLPAPEAALLENKYVAFVSADSQGEAPNTLAQLYAGLAGLNGSRGSYPNQQTVGICITADGTASLFLPIPNAQNVWQWPSATPAASATFSAAFVSDVLKPAGGIAEVPYCVPRGNEADMRNNVLPIRKLDGMPFYCRDKECLYIYDVSVAGPDKWVPLSDTGIANATVSVPIGGIIIFPHVLLDPSGNIPTSMGMPQFLPADGREVSKIQYPILYSRYGDTFGTGSNIPPVDALNNFRLPVQADGIVRSY